MKFAAKPYDLIASEIIDIMQNEEGIKEIFQNKVTRLASSDYSAIVRVDDESIGFINLVSENICGFLFVDLGIKKEFRGKGYCNDILDTMVNMYNKSGNLEYLIAEIKDYNTPANNSLEKLGVLIDEVEDRKFYLLQKDKASELINNTELYEKLKKHNRSSLSKQKVLAKTR